ncbi:hypothetical protein ACHQM5_019257 [Ranunculus cassubicifolius]
MADYASGAIGESFKCTYSHIEREIGYFVHFRTNVANLKVQVELLSAKRNDVKEQIRQATMNGEAILNTVETWLSTTEGVLGRTTNLDEKAAAINRWFKGWFCSRFLLGRSAQKEIRMVKWLVDEVDAFEERVSYRRPVQDLITAPLEVVNAIGGSTSDEIIVRNLMTTPSKDANVNVDKTSDGRPVQNLVFLTGDSTSNEEVKAFGARVTTAKQVIEALKNDGTSLFGVYGMPGVGKTTLISALAIYVKEKKIFDEVVVVTLTRVFDAKMTLTQIPDIRYIQDDIANGLGLKFDGDDSLSARALRLSRRLSQDRKTLLVLDNLWKEVTLVEVGIPQGVKSCKVVFTTRDTDVCNSMDTGDSRIKVDVLTPEESWDLFRKKAGGEVDSPDFRRVARDVLNECQGLPLLIVTLGKALYRKDKTYWDAALESLRNSTLLPNPFFTGMPQVFCGMKLSYDYLVSEETKFCFLLCCLFPDGYHINMDQLFHYMMGEKILTKASTLQAARLHLHLMVDKLISSCLLLQDMTGCVMMHDVIRDVALAIASDSREGNGFIVKAGVQLYGWPNMQLADCKRLSFITTRGNHMRWSLPNQIRAVNLLTLSFHGNERLEKIPASFFEETPNLLAVDLSYTSIKVLPQSIMSLAKIVTLLLEGCLSLDGVYLSSTMERLEILSLRYSAIESVVVSRKMTTIKFLDLSYTSNLIHIRQNIISSFTELEELYLFESFRAWEPERIEPGETSGRMSKVKHHAEKDEPEGSGTSSSAGTEHRGDSARLSEVTSLHRLTSLELHVGSLECLFKSIPNWENLTRFKIAVGVIDDFSPFGRDDGLQMEKSMYIELDSRVVGNWVKVLLGRTTFLQLKGSQSLVDLLQLEPSREQKFFDELKVLILREIGPQILSDSSSVQEVSSGEKNALELSDSGRFTSLIPCDRLVRLQTLNKLVIMNCKYLKKLIHFEVEGQAVSTDASSSSRVDLVKFSNIPASSAFPNLTYLRVCACAELRCLFPMRIIRILSQLEMLHISNCRRLEMVIVHENAEDVGKADDEKAILPKLRILSLEGLTGLSHIIQQDVHLELPVLEELTVDGCGGLQKLPFGPGSVPQLTKLVVEDDDWFDALKWDDKHVKQRLYRLLNGLHLKGCRSLRDVELLDQWDPTSRSVRVTDYKGSTLIPCNFLKKMPHLKKLVIENCQELQMINVGEEDETVEEEFLSVGASSSSSASMSKFSKSRAYPVFANLSFLRVSGCSRLKYLCPMSVVRGLLQLEKLYIHDCAIMETVIKHENDDKRILPKLRILSLEGLGSLSDVDLELPALKELKVKGCEKFESSWCVERRSAFSKLKWEDENVKNQLYLKKCTSLKDVESLDSWHPAALGRLEVTHYEGAILVHRSLLWRLSNLELLVVASCPNLETVVEFGGTNKAGDTSMGARLSSSLVFPNLTVLKVAGCPKLRYLLPMGAARDMVQLKVLNVSFCSSMEMIIEYENVEDGGDAAKDKAILPKLEELRLTFLPKLWSFVGQDIRFDWPSLETLTVSGCPVLKKLPLGPASVPKLNYFVANPRSWFDSLEWEDEGQELKSRLQNLMLPR